MSSESENDETWTPQIILGLTEAEAEVSSINSLPEKSRKKYESVYKAFMDWQSHKKSNSFSENVLLEYFKEMSEKYKCSSLWTQYSMLRSTLNLNNGISIEGYSRLRAFLKRKSEGFRAKKAKTFTPEEIHKFIFGAPDVNYLATKVALIMGIIGGCRTRELHSMNIRDIQDLGSSMIVTVPATKSNVTRKFTITDHFYQVCLKYGGLRPTNIMATSFFLHYHNGKCTAQQIGINKLRSMGTQIATFLRLPNPKLYTGHTFRRSSATLQVAASGDGPALERLCVPVAQKCAVEPVRVVMVSTDQAFPVVKPASVSTSTQTTSTRNETLNFCLSSTSSVHFTDCSNLTINFVTNKCGKEK